MKFDLIKEDSISYTPAGTKRTAKLYRIIALEDFENPICGKVVKYTIGGYVESIENLDSMDGSWIRGTARVVGKSKISGNSLVDWDAVVIDSELFESVVTRRAYVMGMQADNSVITDSATVIGKVTLKNSNLKHSAAIHTASTLIVSGCQLEHLSYIKGSGSVSNSKLQDGASILGENLTVVGCALSGVAQLNHSASGQTLSKSPELSITTHNS